MLGCAQELLVSGDTGIRRHDYNLRCHYCFSTEYGHHLSKGLMYWEGGKSGQRGPPVMGGRDVGRGERRVKTTRSLGGRESWSVIDRLCLPVVTVTEL